MKYLNKLTVLFSVLSLGLFASCDEDQVGAIYSESGVTFTSSALTSVVVSPNDPTFTVDLFRGDTGEALTGTVSMTATIDDANDTPLSGCTVSSYSFAAGEATTTVTVDVTPLEIGVELNVTLTIDGENVAVGGTASTSLTVSKDYSWVSLGTGTFADNWVANGMTYNVEIYKADGFERYRVMNPYTQCYTNDDGEWGNWISLASAPAYITFWTASDGTISFTPYALGLNYQGSSSQPIYVYPPTAFSGLSAEYNKWVNSKTAQLAPYYYVPAAGGGWNNTDVDGVIVITLP
ncbi:MAG: hypothetical protein Q4D56_09550 [Bacteroides sp.]|nr:hypothetical protein [Bacteroides sp.]